MVEKNYGPNKKFIMFTIVAILVICTGVTLAYWIGDIFGTGNPMTFKSANLRILFTGGEAINAQDIKPGWSTSKTFSVENEGDTPYKYNIIIKDLINTMVSTNGLQYKITSTNGFNMEDYEAVPKSAELTKKVLAYSVEIGGATTHNYTIEFRYYDDPDVDQSEDMGKEFAGTLFIEEGTINQNNLAGKIASKYNTTLTRDSYTQTLGSETPTTGVIYKTGGEGQTEDGSEVYYFAGNVADNWVKFGRDSNNADLYWRIIRTNEDGSIRLLYAGTSVDTTEGYIKEGTVNHFKYNNTMNNALYAGYMYGTTGSINNNRQNTNNSEVKNVLDNWYNLGINTKTDSSGNKYDSYVSKSAIYCNDRATEEYLATGYTYYATYNRINKSDTVKPSYRCGYNTLGIKKNPSADSNWETTEVGVHANASDSDKFSVNTSSGGNGKLTYPVGLMTADEIVFAGGKSGMGNTNTYYEKNSLNESVVSADQEEYCPGCWWTMSPSVLSQIYYMFGGFMGASLNSDGGANTTTSFKMNIRPVISIKSCASISTGTGTSNSPFEFSVDSTCINSTN